MRSHGKPLQPTTAHDPLLRQIFAEQERLNLATTSLAKISHVHATTIADLRHPNGSKGKRVFIHQVKQLAIALDFKWPDSLEKNE